MRVVRSSWVALAVAGALAGCGGGGGAGGGGGGGIGGGGPVLDGPRAGSGGSGQRTGAADFTGETTRNWGLAAVGGDAAHAASRTGAGVTVGIVDTGIDLTHPDFAGAIAPASTDIITGVAANVADQGGHGTLVAGVIGARKDGFDAVGVAPESTLLAVRADSPGSCLAGSCSFYHSDLATATNYAVAQGAQVMNFSLGGSGMDTVFSTALTGAVQQNRIVVAAAGNSQGANPIDPAKWLALNGQGLGLAVGATDSTGNLAWFSNKAGVAKDFFLVAPGQGITTSANGGGVATVNGTSFAAPHVAGAAAVIWGAAPYLTGAQVVDILLTSATDLGAAGVDTTYGHGMLNLDAALQPLGTLTLPTGATVASGGAPLASTSLALGGAFGNALGHSGRLSSVAAFDAYGRPFAADLSATVKPAPVRDLSGWLSPSQTQVATAGFGEATTLTLAAPEAPSPMAIQDRPGQWQPQPRFALSSETGGSEVTLARGFGLGAFTGLAAAIPEAGQPLPSGDPLASPYLGLAGDGNSAALGHRLGDGVTARMGFSTDDGGNGIDPEAGRQAMLGEMSKRWQDGTVVGFQLGRLGEDGGPLGSTADGAFAFGSKADTAFTTVYAATPLTPSSTLFGSYSSGLTSGDGLGDGLLREFSTLRSESYALGVATRDVGSDGDRVTLVLSRPLRVADGSATLDLPTGRTMDGQVLTSAQRVSLSPTGAETDLEATYAIPLAGTQKLVLGGMVMFEPGHDADAPPAFAGGMKYRVNW